MEIRRSDRIESHAAEILGLIASKVDIILYQNTSAGVSKPRHHLGRVVVCNDAGELSR
ncbi:hypothetical protein APY04_3364 [Hyphomicrobium sulfonivorans]|uniref:Uncharacterized protein n=1 Tax=Hyphomicrobium sulfonivorans TaxID=121290 RepID=A0A109B9X9_HYPSL|nr:hypothetical protein APY04_3364 [Hyphomicrobium sulfonivorans]